MPGTVLEAQICPGAIAEADVTDFPLYRDIERRHEFLDGRQRVPGGPVEVDCLKVQDAL